MSAPRAPLPTPWRVFSLCLLVLFFAAPVLAMDKPDLARLYENSAHDPNQPPVILIHGLMGSTLVDATTRKEYWPGGLGALAFSDYRSLVQMADAEDGNDNLVPGDLVYGIAGVDFYSALVDSLEKVGNFHRGVPGQPAGTGDARRHYYVFLYDWRKDNIEAVRQLHALIEQIRIDYNDPKLRVDIIAHSNGGLIANYYLRYGPTDVLEQPEFTPWDEGDQRIRRLVMLGTPSLGSVRSVERLLYGMRIGLRTIPVEVMASLATPFQSLPHPAVQSIVDVNGNPVALDIYDPEMWKARHWSVYSPEVMTRVRSSGDTIAAGDAAVARLQSLFVQHLHRAQRFELALTARFRRSAVEIAVFGGDCRLTSARGLLVQDASGSRVIFRPAENGPSRITEPGKKPSKADRIDYERLLADPGDGLVTRSSQVGRLPLQPGQTRSDAAALPVAQTFFLCEAHDQLTNNTYFQNNLLYFLLSR
ncbi:lipase/acyltransferase domain-containing protein [Arenimonas oryziterrae]|uniref:Uncharacterized protein n=1 Tax=Arenimonas oryziterrae DSM 21050 = YC6267 TaxID=1121015 RepID=A0A091AWU8_9GAMM|nr:hypothetical protein [Arenimonas oryziterrae]KFN43891.1 hypothetical protein N789_08055 [Arenimonas oryziterrae DSM 21050 = YC6267]